MRLDQFAGLDFQKIGAADDTSMIHAASAAVLLGWTAIIRALMSNLASICASATAIDTTRRRVAR